MPAGSPCNSRQLQKAAVARGDVLAVLARYQFSGCPYLQLWTTARALEKQRVHGKLSAGQLGGWE